jgi:DNA-nicking Smr family endonuclease
MTKKPDKAKKQARKLGDAELFHAVMTDAVPLDPETRRRYVAESGNAAKKSAPEPPAAKAKRTAGRKPVVRATSLPTPATTRSPAPSTTFDRVTLRQVKQRKIEIDGRLDLHGMTQAQAHARLKGFIESSARAGKRCVLVITGKGAAESEGPGDLRGISVGRGVGRGILRQMTPNWLADAAISRYVVDFQAALPRDGGSGALYVRLRRPK